MSIPTRRNAILVGCLSIRRRDLARGDQNMPLHYSASVRRDTIGMYYVGTQVAVVPMTLTSWWEVIRQIQSELASILFCR
jgi:hypothetical protein